MKHLLDLEKRINSDPGKASEIEWAIHFAWLDGKGAANKDCCEKAAAELEGIRAKLAEAIKLLQEIADDKYCDNDGRGCGSGGYASAFLDKMKASDE